MTVTPDDGSRVRRLRCALALVLVQRPFLRSPRSLDSGELPLAVPAQNLIEILSVGPWFTNQGTVELCFEVSSPSVSILSFVTSVLMSVTGASAQSGQSPRAVQAFESCHATGTVRQFRDNEFSRFRAEPALAGSLGLGCEVIDIKGMPFGSSLGLGVFGEVLQVAPISRRSGMSGDMLTKNMGTMGFVGGTAEYKLRSFGAVTPSLMLRYGVEVGSLVLPRGSYTDADGWNKVFAKRYTQEIGMAACLDYNRSVKFCAEFSKLTYDTYPHIWLDPNGVQQGRPEAITAANEIVGRIVVPFSNFRM